MAREVLMTSDREAGDEPIQGCLICQFSIVLIHRHEFEQLAPWVKRPRALKAPRSGASKWSGRFVAESTSRVCRSPRRRYCFSWSFGRGADFHTTAPFVSM